MNDKFANNLILEFKGYIWKILVYHLNECVLKHNHKLFWSNHNNIINKTFFKSKAFL